MRAIERTKHRHAGGHENAVDNHELVRSVQDTFREFQAVQQRIQDGEIGFADFYHAKLSLIETDGQPELKRFIGSMFAAGAERGQVIGQRMSFGAFYAYEVLKTYSMSKGQKLPAVSISKEPFRAPKLLKARFGGLISRRPDLAEITMLLSRESTRRGAMSTVLCFEHLFQSHSNDPRH